MHRHALTDEQWVRVQPLLPWRAQGRKSTRGDRLFVDGVIYRARNGLFVRPLDQLAAASLAGPGVLTNPFVSPDGQWVGFFSGSRLQKVAVTGGPPVALATIAGAPRGAAWNEAGTIVYAVNAGGGLYEVPAAGGTPRALTTPNAEYNRLFEFLPMGHFRHADHRFEWTRAEFRGWADGVATRRGYEVRYVPIGPVDQESGPPTQLAVFSTTEEVAA